jgi:uracil-DNA glycosylase
MMTREDMMRELELLPVWQSRAPAPEVPAIKDASRVLTPQDIELKPDMQVQVEDVVVKDSLVNIEESSDTLTPLPIESPTLTYIASENGEYLFVQPNAAMSADELQLFQNICKALRIKNKPAENSSDVLASIKDVQAKLLVVMGEAAAQMILQSAEPITHLSGKLHQLHGVTLIATYDLLHLLQNPADKAKVWRDLCMGLQILQDLKVANS